MIEHCIAGGVAGLVIAGTTGEGYALRADERLKLFAAAHRQVGGRVSLIAGCNAGSTREVIELVLCAKEFGYHAILLSAPHTSLPSPRELAAHFEMVAQEVCLPIILYNFPARAGVEMTLEVLERLRDIPEIVAIKEASGDFSRFLMMRRVLGTTSRSAAGRTTKHMTTSYGVGKVGSLAPRMCFLASMSRYSPLSAAAISRVDEHCMPSLLPWIQDMEAGGYNQKAKLGLRLVGVEVGEVRSPLEPLPLREANQYEQLLMTTIDAVSNTSAHLTT